MTNYQILSAVHRNGNQLAYTTLMDLSLAQNPAELSSDKMRIETLIGKGYLSGRLAAYETIRITHSGLELLDALNEHLQKHKAEAETVAANERKQFHFSLASALIGAVLVKLVDLLFSFVP